MINAEKPCFLTLKVKSLVFSNEKRKKSIL